MEVSKFENRRNCRGLKFAAATVAWSCLLVTSFFLPTSANLANESSILLGMKAAWGNPPILSTWRSRVSPCVWQFVTCDSANSTVTELVLGGENVNASLPESIGELVNLRVVTMSWGLIGQIPASIGRLVNLQQLNLGRNSFSGFIPPEIGNLTNLITLDLSQNDFQSQEIPATLSNLTKLTYLNLVTTNLNGPIPGWIGNLSQLVSLQMDYNNFQGSIPREMGELTKLVNLSMVAAGTFNGLPAELGNMTSLSTMVLPQNSLTGNIPDSFGNLKNLTMLNLNNNILGGPIPPSLGFLSLLLDLDLGDNRMTSNIPAEIGNNTALINLVLSQNRLSGIIPPELGGLLSVIQITLSSNRLSGPIPPELGQLASLQLLELNSNDLSGPIPVQLSELQSVRVIDLSLNNLNGTIPQNLTELPNLQMLSLEGNCLTGAVPQYNTSNGNLQFDFGTSGGNCFNTSQTCKCDVLTPEPAPTPSINGISGQDEGSSDTAARIYIAIGVAVGSVLVLTALLALLYLRQRNPLKSKLGGSNTYRAPVRQYSLSEVLAATDNLTTKVGEGGYATVYRGAFSDGTVAAVKHFNKKKPVESFEQEAELHAHLNHRFLVNLVGYCEEGGEFMLMYDFMDRGNLFENLHGLRSSVPLTWDERVKILISVARGIEYLHYGTDPQIIHRDIKSANILLASSGSTLNAKLADFGLGKHTTVHADDFPPAVGLDDDPVQPSPTRVGGTLGYMDPEYATTALLSPKSDVYSFGVVLLELITGRQSVFLEEERISLAFWAMPYLEQDKLWGIVDPKLVKGTFPEEQLFAVAALARQCIQHDQRNRPTMAEVMKFLSELFHTHTMLIDPCLESKSTDLEDSSTESTNLILNQLRQMIPENSMNYTQSELLPRD